MIITYKHKSLENSRFFKFLDKGVIIGININ